LKKQSPLIGAFSLLDIERDDVFFVVYMTHSFSLFLYFLMDVSLINS